MFRHTAFLVINYFLFFSAMDLYPKESYQTKEEPQLTFELNPNNLIQWARDHLPQTGVLMEEKRGFVYLKVDDDYINRLYPMLGDDRYAKPPYFRRHDSPGAHISIFYVDERGETGQIKEIGEKYSFKIIKIAFVPPKTHEYIVLEVEAPSLEQLREKYGLQRLLKGHNFHITIAKKKEKF